MASSTGYSIILIKEFDNITTKYSAHPHAFLKPFAYLPFKTLDEAVENIKFISQDRITSILSEFLHQNIPPKDTTLHVAHENFGKALSKIFPDHNIVWTSTSREISRIVRANCVKLMKGLISQPGTIESMLVNDKSQSVSKDREIGKSHLNRANLLVSFNLARNVLEIEKFLTNSGITKVLGIIDNMDRSIVKSSSMLLSGYLFHFPEISEFLKKKIITRQTFLRILIKYALRISLIDAITLDCKEFCSDVECDTEPALELKKSAMTSLGQDMNEVDAINFKICANRILNLISAREKLLKSLDVRARSLAPNLSNLFDKVLDSTLSDELRTSVFVSRLIHHAGSLTRLATVPTTRVLSLGASKALFRTSGSVIANQKGLISTNISSDYSRKMIENAKISSEMVRRYLARLLAAKTTIAARVDCFKDHNPVSPNEKCLALYKNYQKDLEMGNFGLKLSQQFNHQLITWANSQPKKKKNLVLDVERKAKLKARKNIKKKKWKQRKIERASCPILPIKTFECNIGNTIPGDEATTNGNHNKVINIKELISEEEMEIFASFRPQTSGKRKNPNNELKTPLEKKLCPNEIKCP